VTDFSSYDELVKQVSQKVKGNGLNLLVNNAGVPGKFARISYFKAEHMIDTFTVNTVAPLILTKVHIFLKVILLRGKSFGVFN
jgi:short-subunit dehydrogenase